LLAEVIEELDIGGNTIGVSGVGCSTRMLLPLDIDGITTAHGRPPDVATAIKRSLRPEPIVFTLQGDGDSIAIGAGSLLSAALRGEQFTIIMLNNAIYGTTGGQMAPTTLLGQVTTTTPQGRQSDAGFPAHVPELLAGIPGVAYAARGTVHTPASYQRTRKYLKTAFQTQIDKVGLSFVEILVACPPNWHLSPIECLTWIEEKMIAEFPLGEFKNAAKTEIAKPAAKGGRE
jgi:2-oxoglutarate ferredoxin oxidoreductase subunit beta